MDVQQNESREDGNEGVEGTGLNSLLLVVCVGYRKMQPRKVHRCYDANRVNKE
jgi:hypothetical protein